MKIVVTTIGTTGDIEPFIALAQELLSRGHVLTFCSDEFYKNRVEQLGIEFRAASAFINEAEIRRIGAAVTRQTSPLRQFEVLRDFHLQNLPSHYGACVDVMADSDVIVCHAIHTVAQAAAADLGKPWIRVVLDPSLTPTSSYPPPPLPNLGAGLNRLLWSLAERSLRALDKPLHDMLLQAGSRQSAMRMFRTPSPLLNLLACSDAVTGPLNDLPQNFRFTGFWSRDDDNSRLSDGLSAFLEANPKPLLVSLGSMAGVAREKIQAVFDQALPALDVPVVIQQGAAAYSAAASGERGLGVGFEPHHLLFPLAGCVIHHGGAGTTAAACRAGVPSVVIPHFGDQHYWANRLYRKGVAPRPLSPEQISVNSLSRAVKTALSSGRMANQCADLRDLMRAENGIGRAADMMEHIVRV
ncbi:MAG: glycosyltransferase [Gammaproteobacteria bacterium]